MPKTEKNLSYQKCYYLSMEQGVLAKILLDLTSYILPFLAIVFILGFSGLPITSKILKSFGVNSFFFSIYFSLFVISSFIFTLGTFTQIPMLNKGFVVLSLVVWSAINWYQVKASIRSEEFKSNALRDFKNLLPSILLFFILFFSMYGLLARRPEIYQIERFMDFGFIKTIESTKTLPLPDFWFSNNTTNYYYFSHLLGYVVLSLCSVNVLQGFYLLTCLLFAVTGTLIFTLTSEVLNHAHFDRSWKIAGGLFSVFLFNYSGSLHSIKWLLSNLSSGEFFQNQRS